MKLPSITPRFAALGEPYSLPIPTRPLPNPRLLHLNVGLAAELGLDGGTTGAPEFAALMAGNTPWPGFDARASVYAGHQSGSSCRSSAMAERCRSPRSLTSPVSRGNCS